MNNTYVKQKLDELHLIDDFLFFQMMNHPKYGPKFSRLLLKLILGRDVGKLHVIPQHPQCDACFPRAKNL